MIQDPVAAFTLAYTTFVLALVTPGPANILIATTAMKDGRGAAFWTAFGVVSGSLFWGVMAATGLTIILASSTVFIGTLRLLGAAYLLWLGVKAMLSAIKHRPDSAGAASKVFKEVVSPQASAARGYIMRGMGLHLANPKSIVAWTVMISGEKSEIRKGSFQLKCRQSSFPF